MGRGISNSPTLDFVKEEEKKALALIEEKLTLAKENKLFNRSNNSTSLEILLRDLERFILSDNSILTKEPHRSRSITAFYPEHVFLKFGEWKQEVIYIPLTSDSLELYDFFLKNIGPDQVTYYLKRDLESARNNKRSLRHFHNHDSISYDYFIDVQATINNIMKCQDKCCVVQASFYGYKLYLINHLVRQLRNNVQNDLVKIRENLLNNKSSFTKLQAHKIYVNLMDSIENYIKYIDKEFSIDFDSNIDYLDLLCSTVIYLAKNSIDDYYKVRESPNLLSILKGKANCINDDIITL